MSRFDELVRQLAAAKDHQTRLERAYQPHINSLKTAKDAVNLLDKSVRNEAMEEFLKHGDRTPHDAVEVKSVEKRVWNTEHNVLGALEFDGEVLKFDQERIQENTLLLVLQVAVARTIEPSVVNWESVARTMRDALLDSLEIDERALAELVKEGKAEWASPKIVKEDVVHVKSRLGEYLFADQPSEDSTEVDL